MQPVTQGDCSDLCFYNSPANPAAARASPTATMELACRGKDQKNTERTHTKTQLTSCPTVTM